MFFFLDTPNRRTTIVRRFCQANGLPVLKDEDDVYTDEPLCILLDRLGINWLALSVDNDGYASPAPLSATDAAKARSALAATAAAGPQFRLVAAPAPQRITRLQRDGMAVSSVAEVTELRYVIFSFSHPTKLSSFFARCVEILHT